MNKLERMMLNRALIERLSEKIEEGNKEDPYIQAYSMKLDELNKEKKEYL